MEKFNIITWTICMAITVLVNSLPLPGHHHIHHRIYVPQRIKTIHHTKIIKVPQHHHYFHEKEKIIQVEKPHHKEHDLDGDFKGPKLPLFDHKDSFDDFSELGSNHHYGHEGHNIFKKHAVAPKNKSRKRVAQRKIEKEEEDEEDEKEEEEEE